MRWLTRSRAHEDRGDRWLVVGLGNPGERYARTRHNAGYMVIDALLGRHGAALRSHKSGCLVSEPTYDGKKIVLARPTTYMNESGRNVRALMGFYKAPLEKLVVVHDEIDIPFGEVRIKNGGGTAGHNGLASLAAHLGSKDFVRVRVGVSRPPGRQDPADYVLSEFGSAERRDLPVVIEHAADAVERILELGAERAMNELNTRQ